MYKRKYALFVPAFMIIFLPTSTYAADLTLQCEGAIHRLGGAYVRSISLQLELFWKSGTYIMFDYKDGVRTRIGGGRVELNKNYIILNNGNWAIDRKSGVMNLSYANDTERDTEKLVCRPNGNKGNIF